MKEEFKKTVQIKTTPEKVWDALINPVKVEKYMFGSKVQSKWRPGYPVEFYMIKEGKEILVVKGDVVKINPPYYLEHTLFPVGGEIEDIRENYLTVIYHIEASGDKSTITITQRDFSKVAQGEQRYQDTIKGWEVVLPKLIEVAEE